MKIILQFLAIVTVVKKISLKKHDILVELGTFKQINRPEEEIRVLVEQRG